MKKALVFSFLTLFIGVTVFSVDADARRFGGGKSFGKMFNKQKSFSTPKQSLTKQKAAPGAKTGSRAGGMMGILGGLAMGGLLGAMFFGGAFEGINFMDILIFVGIAFILFRLFRGAASQRQQEYAHAGHQAPHDTHQDNNDAFMGSQTSSAMATPDIDHEHFVSAARDIFMRMQAGWDAKNMDDIRSFCTPDVAANIQAEMEQVGENSNKTEVGMLNADIVETWVESDLEWVAVHFNAMLKEETLDSKGTVIEIENSEANETWIFQHNPRSEDPTWYLAGIQQA